MREGFVIKKMGNQDSVLTHLCQDFGKQQVVVNALIRYLSEKGIIKTSIFRKKKPVVDRKELDVYIGEEWTKFLSQVKKAQTEKKILKV